MTYYFGIYHWRKGARPVALLAVALSLAIVAYLLPSPASLIAILGAVGVGAYGVRGVETLLRPRPWQFDRRKYDAVGELVRISEGDRVLDVGSGTGRSLVGLAPYLRDCDSIVAVDRFDDGIILGNTPGVFRRNVSKVGLDVSIAAADAANLPFDDGSIDVITVCMVLHDLSDRDVRRILAELHRVCAPGGTVGLLELPLLNDREAVTPQYWEDVVVDSGFDVRSVRTIPWKGDRSYAVLAASRDADRRHDPRPREGRTRSKT